MANLISLEKKLKALGNLNRLRILHKLKKSRGMTAGEITEFLNISPSAVSNHLGILFDAGIIRKARRGKYASFRLGFGGYKWVKQLLREGI